ncbi:MAG: Crp/Fnr family transcriptional regulator [Acidimicrobiia bacterium]
MEWPLLRVVSDDERSEILSSARRRRFARGDIVFHEGDPGDTLHLIARGHVAVRVTTPLGDAATLLILKPGDFFGEMAIVSPGPRNATVIALDDTETLGLHRDTLDVLRAEHPAVDKILLEALIVEVRRLSALLVEALYVPVQKRIWRRLIELGAIYGSDGDATIVIPLTQEDLAQVVGTTRSTLNKLLRGAEQAGILRSGRGSLEIVDQEALAHKGR